MIHRRHSVHPSQSADPNALVPDPIRQRLQQLPGSILDSFTPEQYDAVYRLLDTNSPKPSPKIIDLRFVVDLIVSRFYVVVLVGKDRRTHQRRYVPVGVSRIGNLIAAIALLLSLNLFVSIGLFLVLYLLKSGIGVDLFQNHLSDFVHLP